MPRSGAIIFRDIVGKLTVLRITCDKCGRSGQYRADRLIMRYGIDAKLFDWSDGITACTTGAKFHETTTDPDLALTPPLTGPGTERASIDPDQRPQ
jgi:hypothetical protein